MIVTTEDLIRATGGVLLNGDMGIFFHGVCTDSRQIKPGELFVALKGPRFDGHDFVAHALEQGAKGALVSHWPEDINIFEIHRALSLVQVKDTLKALGDLAAYMRRGFSGPVVGITGSFGKSTTKELLAAILTKAYAQVAKNPGNWNNLIGVPLSILNALESAQAWVLELATNQPGEIARLTEIVSPTVALLVGVGRAHLEGLGSFEGVLEEKLALFEKAPAGAFLVYPFDQPEVQDRVAQSFSQRPTLSFGLKDGADLKAERVEFSPEGMVFDLCYQGETMRVRLPLWGYHFVYDALAASAAAVALGVPLEKIVQGLAQGQTLSHRLQPKKIGPHLVLDDTYNANPDSLAAACAVARELAQEFGQKIAVVGDMKELGESAAELHREAGALLAEVFDCVLAIGHWATEVVQGAGAKGKALPDKEALVQELWGLLEGQSSLVLVKGSRAMRMEEIVKRMEEGR